MRLLLGGVILFCAFLNYKDDFHWACFEMVLASLLIITHTIEHQNDPR